MIPGFRVHCRRLNYLLEQGATPILCSHLGRPKGVDPVFSLKPVAEYLATLVDVPVKFANDCFGSVAEEAVMTLQPGEILVLENTRFHAGETKNDPEMAKQMAVFSGCFR